MGHCAVLPGFYGVFVQALLFIFSMVVLGIKFWRDTSGRTARQFTLDSSKQIAGAGWTHCLNLLCARALGRLSAQGDQCAVYWVEIMIDTTLGVAVEFYLLQLLLLTVRRTLGKATAVSCTSGKYFDSSGSFQLRGYMLQLCAWLVVVTGMKCSMILLMVLSAPVLQPAAALVLAPVLEHPHIKLLVVMIVTPGIMNAVQFWLVDNIFVHTKEELSVELDEDLEASSKDAQEQFALRAECSLERLDGGAAGATLLCPELAVTKSCK